MTTEEDNMSKIKNFIADEIERLAQLTGYGVDFLMGVWNEMLEDGEDDWSFFVGVTLELDW